MPSFTRKVSSYFIVKDAARAIDFYEEAFGATEVFRMTDPSDGRIGHAELRFGETLMMLADEYPDFGALSPDTVGGSPVTFHMDTASTDEALAQALSAGRRCCGRRPIRVLASGWRRFSTPSVTAGCCLRPSNRSPPRRCSGAGTRTCRHERRGTGRARGG